jgi:hypothetical protein
VLPALAGTGTMPAPNASEASRLRARRLSPYYKNAAALQLTDHDRTDTHQDDHETEGTVRNKAVYLALGIRADGRKEVLGL